MNFAELKSQVTEMQKSGNLKNQTVEVVVNTQKYSIDKVETAEGFALKVNRGNYRPFTAMALLSSLEVAAKNLGSDAKALIQVGDNEPVEINKVFLSNWFLEIASE